MKIISVDKVGQRFPDNTTAAMIRVCFDIGGEIIKKIIRVSGCPRAISNNRGHLKDEYYYQLGKAAREADRDIAYKKYGHSWRDHTEFKTPFWKPLVQDEFNKLIFEIEC